MGRYERPVLLYHDEPIAAYVEWIQHLLREKVQAKKHCDMDGVELISLRLMVLQSIGALLLLIFELPTGPIVLPVVSDSPLALEKNSR